MALVATLLPRKSRCSFSVFFFTYPLNVRQDQADQERDGPLLLLHDVDERRGDVLLGLDGHDGLQELAQRGGIVLEVLTEGTVLGER